MLSSYERDQEISKWLRRVQPWAIGNMGFQSPVKLLCNELELLTLKFLANSAGIFPVEKLLLLLLLLL